MQTSQVSNPVNMFSTPAPASKSPEANASTEPFNKVLSREVAGRRNTEQGAKTQEKETANGTPQQVANDAKPAEAKATSDTGSDGGTEAAESSEATDASAQLSGDLLALVANLAQMQTQTTDTSNGMPAAQDAAAAKKALSADASTETSALITTSPTMTTATMVQDADTAAQRKTASALETMTDRIGASRQQREPAVAEITEPPAPITSELSAKGQALLDGTSVASAKQRTHDFAATMKETMSALPVSMQPTQQAALHATQTAAANAMDKLTPAVGTPAWDQALGQKVVWMVAGGQQSATLTLNPPDLGPLQVVLNVSNSQANATFTAAQPEVRQALEAALPKLRDMLGDAGIQLGQASVNSGMPNQQGGFDQQTAQSSRHLGSAHGRSDVASAEAPVRVSRVQSTASGRGLVDTFA